MAGSVDSDGLTQPTCHHLPSDAGHHNVHVVRPPRRLTAHPGVHLFPGRGEHPAIVVVGEPFVPRQLASGAAAAPEGDTAVTHRRAGAGITQTHLRMGPGTSSLVGRCALGPARACKKAGMRHEDAEEHRRVNEHELWACSLYLDAENQQQHRD